MQAPLEGHRWENIYAVSGHIHYGMELFIFWKVPKLSYVPFLEPLAYV